MIGHGGHAYQRTILAGACFVLAATVVALLTSNSRQTTPVGKDEPALDLVA